MRVPTSTIAALLTLCLAVGFSGLAAAAPQAQSPPSDAPAPSDQDQAYRIGPLDQLDVSVFQVDSLNRSVQVDATGQIDLPLIRQVHAAGKTPRELADQIAGELSRMGYVESPQVSVQVKDSARRKFTVAGQVKTSGVFPLTTNLTLMQGIAAAGGVQSDADLKRIVVFRMQGNRRGETVIDLAKIQKGKADDPEIHAGDVIVVPVSGSRRTVQDMASVLPFIYMAALFR